MSKLKVKDGTPVGNEHLCKRCTWGQLTVGYRESEVVVFCTNTSPNFRVPFPVYDCTEFEDKHRPDYKQMEKLAIHIDPLRVSKKTKGFHGAVVAAKDAASGAGQDKQLLPDEAVEECDEAVAECELVS